MPKNKSIAMVGLTLVVVLLALVGGGSAFAQSIMGGRSSAMTFLAWPQETARCSSSA